MLKEAASQMNCEVLLSRVNRSTLAVQCRSLAIADMVADPPESTHLTHSVILDG